MTVETLPFGPSTAATGAPCPACVGAEQNALSGLFHADCPGCRLRQALNAPEWAQRAIFSSMTDPEERRRFIEARERQ